ncbi:hypothetical protein PJ985_20870 [Streptomyces sp. ACA25]|uniref:hypothetical protein n=1 Tax=Streptomyces sp. ACA25 TaxID=3022596 RepID=UPI0023075AC3|nr:hypothetical protein [Streptomyces sp. ACA25]MDB1090016.1 hypothetical protein [Streptomyces sp. ACA25]
MQLMSRPAARAAAVLLAAVAAATTVPPAAGAAPGTGDRSSAQEYEAWHRADCLVSHTRGVAEWIPDTWIGRKEVELTGVLVEERKARDCARQTIAEFRAYAHNGRLLVDRHVEYLDPADGDSQRYHFSLRNPGTDRIDVIDLVEVRVCISGSLAPAYSCGESVTVPPPGLSPHLPTGPALPHSAAVG